MKLEQLYAVLDTVLVISPSHSTPACVIHMRYHSAVHLVLATYDRAISASKLAASSSAAGRLLYEGSRTKTDRYVLLTYSRSSAQ
jgi:hypothetical protein